MLRESNFRKIISRPLPIALAAVLFFLCFFGGTPGFRDGAHFYGPLFQYIAEEIGAGRLPLWNPYENLGQPLAASPTTMLFYPGTMLAVVAVLLGLNVQTAYAAFTGFHLLLAVGTCYRLVRIGPCSRYASTLAAICYALGGNVLFQWNNVPFLIGAAWFPEALRFAISTIRKNRLRDAVGFGIVLALMILGGDPQSAYHVVLCVAVYFAFSIRIPFQIFSVLRTTGLLFFSGILAFLLAAIQILPAWELGRLSDRSLDVHDSTVYHFSVPPWRLLEFLWPGVGGWQFPENARWFSALPWDYEIWVPSLYMGLIPVLFALFYWEHRGIGLFFRKSMGKRDFPAMILFLLFLLGSLGFWSFVYRFLWQLPGYELFRYPAKLSVVASLFLAYFAARGFDSVFRNEKLLVRLTLFYRIVLIAGFFGVFFLLFHWPKIAEAVPACPLFGPFQQEKALEGILFSAFTVSAIYLLFEIFIRSEHRKPLLIALVLADLFVCNAWMYTTAPRNEKVEMSVLLAEIGSDEEIAPVRIYRFPIWYPPEFQAVASPDRLAEARKWDRESLFPRYALPLRRNVVDVRGTAMSGDYYDFVGSLRSELYYGEPGVFERKLEKIGVRYVVAPNAVELDAERVPLGPDALTDAPSDVSLWKLRNPIPCRYSEYEPNRLVFDVSLDAPETVVVREQFWPGWRAFAGGKEIPIKRVDGIFRGVELPLGNHRVEMIFDPVIQKIGLILSLFGLSITVIAFRLFKHLKKEAGALAPAQNNQKTVFARQPGEAR